MGVGVGRPLEQRGLGTNFSPIHRGAVWPRHPQPRACDFIRRVLSSGLRGVNELNVKNPGRLLAHKRCVAQVFCPHSLFFLLERGRRKQRLPGQWGLGPQQAGQTPTSAGEQGFFPGAEPQRATAPPRLVG